VVQDKPLKQRQPRRYVEVRSEVKVSPGQMLINNLTLPLTERQAQELAYTYLVLGLSWSRDNTENNTSLSQGHHIQLTDSFVDLMMVEKIVKQRPGRQPHIRYKLLPHGKRFLRQFNPSPLPNHEAHINYKS
jgi:hypothetical protein